MYKRLLLIALAVLGIAAVSLLLFSKDRKLMCFFSESNLKTIRKTDVQEKHATAVAQAESPFACNMAALDEKGRERHSIVMRELHQATEEVRELPDGYAFRLADSTPNILLASEFIARERLCCPFFNFELVAEKERGPLWLHLRGREGVKAFIEAELHFKG